MVGQAKCPQPISFCSALQLPRLRTSYCNTRHKLQMAIFDRGISHFRVTDVTPNRSQVYFAFVPDFTFSISLFKSQLLIF